MVRKMKDSGIEWIGDIPEDWEVIKVKHEYNFLTGFTPETNRTEYYDDENGYGWVNISDLDGRKFLNNQTKNRISKIYIDLYRPKSVPQGSLMYSFKLSVGQRAFNVRETYTNEAIASFINNKNIDLNYFYYSSSLIEYNANKNIYGARILNQELIKNAPIPFPSLEEQYRISSFLDNKVEQIEDIENIINDEIESLENYKKSLITEAVTKGLDKNVPMKDSGTEWIGQIPKHWNLKTIKSLTIKSERGTSPRYVDDSTQAKVVNQATFSQGFFDKSNIKFSKIPASQSKGLLKKEDVLIASTGGGVLGKTHYFIENDEYVADGHVTILRTDPFVQISKILYYIFSVNYEMINGLLAKGSTNQTELQSEWLRNFKVPYAPIDEQKAIVFYLDNKCKIIDETISLKQKQLQSLEEYKKSLIYEYVTGKKEAHLGKF